jgi:membrane protease YdiL (CAAX protease family)
LKTYARQPETHLLTKGEWSVCAAALCLHGVTNGLVPVRFHIPASLTTAAAASVMAGRAGAGLEAQALGLQDVPRGAGYGLGVATLVASALLTGGSISRTRALYGHDEIARMTLSRAMFEVMVRIPLGTALPEELIFRGALLGLLSKRLSPVRATGLTAALFGLWHITPTLRRLETYTLSAGQRSVHKAAWVATSVGVTAVAGALLASLRYRSRSLVAPWLVHSAANAAGLGTAWLAARSNVAAKQPGQRDDR